MSGYERIPLTDPRAAKLKRSVDAGFLPENVRCWEKEVEDGVLRVVRTIEPEPDGSRWVRHVSVSHRGTDGKPGRYPTWDEQKEAVWQFAPGTRMYSIMPAQDEPFVNVHETTFHWWETVG